MPGFADLPVDKSKTFENVRGVASRDGAIVIGYYNANQRRRPRG